MVTLPGLNFDRELHWLRIEDARASVGDAAHAIAAGLSSIGRMMRADRVAYRHGKGSRRGDPDAIVSQLFEHDPFRKTGIHFSGSCSKAVFIRMTIPQCGYIPLQRSNNE